MTNKRPPIQYIPLLSLASYIMNQPLPQLNNLHLSLITYMMIRPFSLRHYAVLYLGDLWKYLPPSYPRE